MRRRFLACFTALTLAACALPAHGQGTRFAVLGDAPYGAGQEGEFSRVIDRINADDGLRFAIHVGDLKGGSEPCSDALIRHRKSLLDALTLPWLYTPGDNEWTDCHHRAAGRFNPVERLAFLRKTFFADPTRTHGPGAFALATQGTTAGFAPFVEHQRFELEGIVFASVHVVGSDNGLFPWRGVDRFWMAHLTVKGDYDMFGGTLGGLPMVGVGFNKHLSWTHTVSTGRRFIVRVFGILMWGTPA